MCAWRAGFWPWPAVSTWPRMVSETSPGSTPARSSTALMTPAPSSCAGVLAKAPLKLPTAVRAADAITILVMCPLLGGAAGAGPGVAPARERIRPLGASGQPSSHKAPTGSTGMAGEELGRRPPYLRRARRCPPPCRRGRSAAGWSGPAAAGRRAERPAAAGRWCRARRRRPAPGRGRGRGSTTPPRKRQAPVAVRLRICQPTSRSLAAPAGIATPSASQSSSATKSRAAAPSGSRRASFWNFSEAWIGLISAKIIWRSDTGTRPKAAPRLSSSASARAGPCGADDGAETAGEAAGRGEVPGGADRHQRRDVVGPAGGEPDRQGAAHAVADHRHRAARPAPAPRRAPAAAGAVP